MSESQLLETKKRANNTLIGSMIIIAIEFGTYTTLSMYVGDLCAQFNASVTQVVLLFTIASLVSLVSNFVSAAVINKVSPKILTLVGSIGYIMLFVCMAFGKSLPLLYIGAAGFGLSNTFIGFTVLQPVITWWHAENLGKKLSFLSIAFSITAMVLGFVVPKLLAATGFKTTALLQGGVFGALLIVCSLFLVNDMPDKYGLKPYGAKESADGGAGGYALTGLSVKDSLKTFPFWAIMLAIFLCGIPGTGYTNNASTIYQSMGLDPVKAGLMISLYSAMGIFWNFAYGALSDKLGTKTTNIAFPLFGALVFGVSSFIVGLPGALLVALTFGCLQFYGMLAAVSLPGVYGTKAIGTLIAFGMVASSVGTMVGSPLASSMYESAGNFAGFMRICVPILLVVTALLYFASSKKAVDKVKSLESK